MEKRARSPNYPAISLPDAVAKAAIIYKNQHIHAAPREVVVKSMGYNSVSGASASAFSALQKYGLFEAVKGDVKLSERAMSILHPHDDKEKAEAVRAAAFEPPLFTELAERFPGPLPSVDVVENYLIRKGFAPSALHGVVLAYRETMELVASTSGSYSVPTIVPPTEPVTSMQIKSISQAPEYQDHQNILLMQGDERSLGRHDFDDGTHVRILASSEMDTEEALDWVEFLVKAKRRELEKRGSRPRLQSSHSEFMDDEDRDPND